MVSARVSADHVPVVVVGGELNGLGLVRSLARQAIPVVVVDTRRRRAALWSRHAKAHLVRSYAGQPFIDDLIALAQTFESRPLLFLTDEDAVHSVSEHRERLTPWYRFRLPDDPNVKLLSNKAKFHRFALERRFPVPNTVVMNDATEIGKLGELRFPCVIKPDDKRDVVSRGKERAVRVESLTDATGKATAMLSTPGAIVAQEWITGAESNIYFTLFYRGDDGHVAGIFTGRKLLCSPPDVGSTAVCVAAPEARAELEALTLAFAEESGFVGMGSMEYKWDDVHHRFVMVEPTVGRSDWQEEVATLNGVNIPVAAYRYELGLPALPADAARTPVAWCANFGQRPPATLLNARARMIDGYFRWTDPLPALHYYCLDRPLTLLAHWLRAPQRPTQQAPAKG